MDFERTVKHQNGATSRQVRLLNVWIDDLSVDDVVERLDQDVLFTVNVDHLYQLQYNPQFAEAYAGATMVACDSKYVLGGVLATGRAPMRKACGSDIVPAYWRHHAGNPAISIFLLGAKPGVAAKAQARINRLAGRDIVVGAHGPSMRFVDDEQECRAVIDMVNASRATCLIVGLGAPKQEIWIHRHKHLMPGVKVLMGVGATIDYEAEAVKRAPVWVRRLAMEWLHRVVTDPRRYARRYLRNLKFFWLILNDALGLYRPPAFLSPVTIGEFGAKSAEQKGAEHRCRPVAEQRRTR
jgi:exopolysaccharide biosynthesis WecB/TagA/CpsF family protein